MRELLRATFDKTLADLRARIDELSADAAGEARRHAATGGNVLVIAFGKAAPAMAAGLLRQLPPTQVRGLCVPAQPIAALPPLTTVVGGHPLPTNGSFMAARLALAACRAADHHDHVVFLVSGGGSALLEAPLDDGVGVDEWRHFYRALVGCGAPIDHVNRVRRRLSLVKGGRLALAAQQAAGQHTIVVKDVPGPLADVASGPTVGLPPGPDTLAADLDRFDLLPHLPPRLQERVRAGTVPALPQLPAHVTAAASFVTIADEHCVRAFVVRALGTAGVLVDDTVDVDDQPVDQALDALLARLLALHARHPQRRVAVVTTGELSVPLPAVPGTGGRNQQFALAAARRIAGQPIVVLSAGTDGIDGNSPAAGAIVDGSTVARAGRAGFDVDRHLLRCDAFPLLQAIGDALSPGATGANVRDLRVLLYEV